MKEIFCNPDVCPNCQYIGEGDSWCDVLQKIVLDDWTPTEDFMGAGCPHLEKRPTIRLRPIQNDYQICERCREETKRPAGSWSGQDEEGEPTGGLMFTCDNPRCPIAAKRRRAAAEAKGRRDGADEINGAHDIDPEKFRETRCRAGVTIYQAAQFVGISSATLSAYENRRLPFPILIYNRLMARFNQMSQEDTP